MRNTVVTAVFGVLLLAACSATQASPPASRDNQPDTQAAAAVPTPNTRQQRAYLATLKDIDAGLAVNEDRAIRRGRAICDRVINGSQGRALEEYVVAELSGGNATIDRSQAAKVVKAVKVWCRP